MSLFIVGSCSRITRNIILQLAKNNQYSSITIGDMLPEYQLHERYYSLKRQLADHKFTTQVNIDKLVQPAQLYNHVQQASDVLFVTHDYYYNTTSKTKLMRLVAEYGKNRSHLFFATPAEYDHYGFANPEQNYLQAQEHVRKINPNATFIRSDIQDKTEFFAYYHHSKNILEDQLFKLSAKKGFAPKVVSSQKYAEIVANTLKERTQGKVILVQGQNEVSAEKVDYNRTLDNIDWQYAKENIRHLANKYTGSIGETAERVIV